MIRRLVVSKLLETKTKHVTLQIQSTILEIWKIRAVAWTPLRPPTKPAFQWIKFVWLKRHPGLLKITMATFSDRRKPRSEQDREVQEARWHQMVQKMLFLTQKTANIAMGVPYSIKTKKCSHPEEFISRGANQYGTWTRCNSCKTKLSFSRYGPSNPPKSARKGKKAVVYLEQPKALPYPKSTARGSALPQENAEMLRQEMDEAMRQQAHQLVQGLTQAMSDMVTPLMQQQNVLQETVAHLAQHAQQGQLQMPVMPIQMGVAHQIPAQSAGMIPATQGEQTQHFMLDGLANPNEELDWEMAAGPRGP